MPSDIAPAPRGRLDRHRATARRASAAGSPDGRLVLLTGSDPAFTAQLVVIVRRRLVAESSLVLPQLVLDRPVWSGEQHIGVARQEFQEMARRGFFLAAWQAFGTWHGVPSTVLRPPRGVRAVALAVADQAVAPLRARWRETVIIEIDGGPAAVHRRRQPAQPAHAGASVLRIAHSGDPAEAACGLTRLLTGLLEPAASAPQARLAAAGRSPSLCASTPGAVRGRAGTRPRA